MTPEALPNPEYSPLPEGAGAARLVVCESTGAWAAALRRELARWKIRVQETRSVAECWEVLGRRPASFLVIELTRAGANALLERLAWWERDFPWARVAVVAARSLGACEPLIREAGAVHFVTSPRQLAPLADLACRHLQAAPRRRRSMSDEIWTGLPWGSGKTQG